MALTHLGSGKMVTLDAQVAKAHVANQPFDDVMKSWYVVWRGVAWCGVAWCGVVWRGKALLAVAWCVA